MGKLFSVVVLGALLVSSQVLGADTVSGSVIVLEEKTTKDTTVNVDGLVVVVIPDSGSRPPQNIKVDAGRAYKQLGTVQAGNVAPGGGYTWYLFKPVNAGETTITVSYTENGEGKKVERTHKVKIE